MATILLVEDDDVFRRVLTDTLSREQHEVTTASNGQEAVQLARNQNFDLVITDLIMPEKEGIETIIEIRLMSPGIRIIAMSGGGRGSAQDYLSAALVLGASQSLSKPFSRQDLLNAIEKVLGQNPE
jgi:CheY-like chemotaxis protein